MTEETKKIFSAPWKKKYQVHAAWEVDFEIGDTEGYKVATCPIEQDSNRIVDLPQLWEFLLEATCQKCWSCSCANREYLLTYGCPKKNKDCYVNNWIELLQKVKKGE